jgi:GMP reductase
MRIVQGTKLDFDDVLLIPKRSTVESRAEVTLVREFEFRWTQSNRICTPIISANMLSVTNEKVVKVMAGRGMLACLPKKAKIPAEKFYCIPTFGVGTGARISLDYSGMYCLDVANGYMERFIEMVKANRKLTPDAIIIAGNVVTPEQTEALILAGADIVKVGLGSGGVCSTRIKTGVGYPQLSAVIECADAAHGLGGHVISDGGCKTPGDVCKAFAAGADFVMLGSMLAGHDENGQHHYGMASKTAADQIAGGLKDYRAEEGFDVELPNRGPLQKTLQEIEGGLRSACAYVGARRLKDLPKCATFIEVNRQANTSLWEYRKGE